MLTQAGYKLTVIRAHSQTSARGGGANHSGRRGGCDGGHGAGGCIATNITGTVGVASGHSPAAESEAADNDGTPTARAGGDYA